MPIIVANSHEFNHGNGELANESPKTRRRRLFTSTSLCVLSVFAPDALNYADHPGEKVRGSVREGVDSRGDRQRG
jgi:hypothetical protein